MAQDSRIAARLARLSFADAPRAAQLLSTPQLGWWDVEANRPTSDAAAVVVAALARTADPDGALRALAAAVQAAPGSGLRDALENEPQVRARLLPLLGVSVDLGELLCTNPDVWQMLRADADAAYVAGVSARLAAAVGAVADEPVVGIGSPTSGASAKLTGPEAVAALRTAYRTEVFAIAGRDLARDLPLREVTEQLADLAGHTLQTALAVAAAELPSTAAPCRLAIIAMGKTGSRELNYVSDVDVVFVGEPADPDADTDAALATAAKLAGATMRLCRQVAWEVDANLRPEGKDGPLVRTLASHEAYYRRWASTWEFQALLKARPVAGDAALGAAYAEVIAPLVWTAAERPGFVADVRSMRQRVVDHIPVTIGARDIKLARGGLRDVEFAVQLLQLVHGRGDESLRIPETLPALDALRNGGYVGRDDGVSLVDAYTFLRAVEHRLQLRRLRRTHVLPDQADQLQWLAKAMGFHPDHRGDARAVFESEWDLHAREVRRLHEKLFYRPLLESVARVPSADLRLTTAEAANRLAALGFTRPEAALRAIESLSTGLTRRAALQRTLLPVLLAEFADAPDPDAGLLAYQRLSDELSSTPWYLRFLRDGDAVVVRLATVLGVSRYIGRMLGRAPEALRMLGSVDELVPRPGDELAVVLRDSASRQLDPAGAVAAVRNVRRQELLRTAFADLLQPPDVAVTCSSLSDNMAATLETVLEIAGRSVAGERGLERLPLRFAVIAMGRLGGAELSYGSDADVMFVYQPDDGAEETAGRLAHEVAARLRALLSAPSSTDPPLVVDAALRPEGRNGPLVRSLASYERYYSRWSSAWEAQALLRARPIAGDAELGARFTATIDPVRYPAGGVAPDDLIEIRRLKGRVDSERLPRGADPTTHTKLGRGGLADIEWTIQLLQLDHGHDVPGLRTTRTLDALAAAAQAGLLDRYQADTLATAWRLATRVRNAIVLVRDKPADELPALGTELIAVGRALGYPADVDPGQLVDDYRRAARRARKVVEQVFYDA